ncbi:MAG: hypothetical protein ACT4QE_13755 [Anaerolineales bacterium]
MRKTITILLFAGVLLAACAPDATPALSGGSAPEQAALQTALPTQAVAQTAPTQEPVPTAVEAPTGALTVPPTAEPAQTAPPTAVVVKDTRQLVDVFKVSDPATVNLAAGQPQFVEFFAFW